MDGKDACIHLRRMCSTTKGHLKLACTAGRDGDASRAQKPNREPFCGADGTKKNALSSCDKPSQPAVHQPKYFSLTTSSTDLYQCMKTSQHARQLGRCALRDKIALEVQQCRQLEAARMQSTIKTLDPHRPMEQSVRRSSV